MKETLVAVPPVKVSGLTTAMLITLSSARGLSVRDSSQDPRANNSLRVQEAINLRFLSSVLLEM